MKRIATLNRALNLFGLGKDGFRTAVPGVSGATQIGADFLNAVQESILHVIEHEGLVPSDDYDQLMKAILAPAQLASYDELRAYAGATKAVFITGYLGTARASGIAGRFVCDDSDAVSADNGGTVIVAANGKRWKRAYTGPKVVDWFVAPGDVDSTAAIERAFNSLKNGDALEFTARATYLISYIWAPKTDSLAGVGNTGRGRAVGVLNGKSNITIRGNGATIKAINHDIAANGGLLFIRGTKSPFVTVEGFNFDMTFTGFLNEAAFYPMCGAIVMADDYGANAAQTALCSNFTARDLTFKLFHPLGCFAVTTHPYGTDYDNGYKILSVFASGDSAATTYESQSRNLLIEKIKFLDGHNCYGTWGVGYNNAKFKEISAESWSTSSYVIADGSRTGVDFIAPVRFYQYYTRDLMIDDIKVRARPWAERTGAFVGRCGAVAVNSGVSGASASDGRTVITNVSAMLDSNDPALGGVFDVGILSYLHGAVKISNCTFDSHTLAGVVGIYAYGFDDTVGTGLSESRYNITDCSFGKNISGPPIQVINVSALDDAHRQIKSMIIKGCTFTSWGGEGGVYSYRTGWAYSGVGFLLITGNTFIGQTPNAALGHAIDVPSTNANDFSLVADNVISGANAPYQLGAVAKTRTRDNRLLNNLSNASVMNALTDALPVYTSYIPNDHVTTQATGSQIYTYQFFEYSGAGVVVKYLENLANSTTGDITIINPTNTGKMVQKLIGDYK